MVKESLIVNSINTATVSIVEDDPIVKDRLAKIISASSELSLGFIGENLEQGTRGIQSIQSDVLLLDLGLPDGNGVELIKFIEERNIATGVIVITAFGGEKHVLKAISAGAVGYLLKDEEHQEIEASIQQMLNGGSPVSPSIARYLLRHFRDENAESTRKVLDKNTRKMTLTNKEYEILQQVAKGFTSKEISAMQNLSYHTVTTHIRNIYKKLSVNSRAEALFEAYNTGLL